MVKRVVDTSFWTDMQVIDNYSIEDKYFSLYLMTNDKSTQVGIYPLPKKVMSFETGFTTDVVQVLLERFSEDYGKIIYSEETQEVTVLQSLQHSILKGGKPVSDLLERELANVKDSDLILATYEEMKNFWELSKRKFDKTIKNLFENELTNRDILFTQNDNQNEKQNVNDIYNYNENENHNHNEESQPTNRGAIRGTIRDTAESDTEELTLLQRYGDYLKKNKPEFTGEITPDNILNIYYEQMLGELHPHIDNQLRQWQKKLPKTLILEALHRSTKANKPILYAASIIDNWRKAGVETYKDVMKLDQEYSHKNN